MKKLVHHHLIYQAVADRDDWGASSSATFKKFLRGLVKEIGMQILIPPRV